MIALGASNVISSFFSCYPGCASLSRSLMADSGGGTQVLQHPLCLTRFLSRDSSTQQARNICNKQATFPNYS